MKIFIFIEWALFHSQSLCYVINISIADNVRVNNIIKLIAQNVYLHVIYTKISTIFFYC